MKTKTFWLILFVATALTLFRNSLAAQSDTIPAANDHSFILQSDILQEPRTIWVHLPPGYNQSDRQHYPVIFLLDGEVHFNYVSGMVEYLSSYDVNRMPKVIVIGIVQPNRGRDMSIKHPVNAAGKEDSIILADAGTPVFLGFIRDELVPYIDKKYKTDPYRILIGHSLGGLFAFYAQQKASALFQATVLISPAIGGINQQLTTQFGSFLRQHQQLKNKLFITIGNEDTRQVQTLASDLEKLAPKGVQWAYQQYPDENHFSVTYKSIYDALKFVYSSWFFDYYGKTNLTYQDIERRFDKLSGEYGYRMLPTEDFVNNIGYKQLRSGNLDEAINIFRHNIENFPGSFNVYDSMGEALMKKGDTTGSIMNYKKSLQLNPQNEDAKNNLQKMATPSSGY